MGFSLIKKMKTKTIGKIRKVSKKILVPFVLGVLLITVPIILLTKNQATQKVEAAFLKLDEGYGTTTQASSTNNTGSISGADWANRDMCISENCLYFNGDTDYVSFGDNAAFDFTNSQSFTISLWFRARDVADSYHALFSKTSYGDGYALFLEGATGVLTFALYDDGTGVPSDYISTTTAYDDNKWHHFALTKTGATRMDMYIDGELAGSDTNLESVGDFTNSVPLYLGVYGDTTNYFFQGYLDEINIYSGVARTSDEIKTNAIINASEGGSSVQFGMNNSTLSSGLVGYWKMDEYSAGSGAVTRSDSTPLVAHLTDGSPYAPSVTGKWGRAVSFTAANSEYLSTTDASVSDLHDLTQLTISTWLYPLAQSSEGIIIGKDASNGDFSFRLTRFQDERITFNFSENGFYYGDGNIWSNTGVTTLNEWQLLTVTYDGQYFRLYINDEEQISGEFPYYYPGVTIFNSTNNLTFGAGLFNGGPQFYNGYMDETRIYNRGLTLAEIKKIYNAEPGPDAYFDFNENNGTTTYDKGPLKISGTLGSGSLAPAWVTGKFGSAIESDGVDDVLDFDNDTYWDYYTTDNLTWTTWIKLTGPTGSDGGYLIGDGGGPLIFLDRVSASTYQICWVTADPACSSTQTFAYNKWYHIGVVKEGTSNVKIYRDGILLTTDTSLSEGNDDESTMEILGGGSTWRFKGVIDEVRFYRHLRTQEQIVQDMNGGHPVPGSPIGSTVAWYKFDEGYGDNAYNSGNGGTVLNGNLGGPSQTCPGGAACPTRTTDGRFGAALDFDGSTDEIRVPGNSALEPAELTVSGWLKTSAAPTTGQPGVVGNYNLGDYGYVLAMGSTTACPNKLMAYISVGYPDNLCSTTSVNDGVWHHFVMTYKDGEGEKIYIDGILENTDATITGAISYGTSNFYIGSMASTTGFFFDGMLDDIKVYSSALTPDQIALEYNQGKATKIGSLSTDADGNPDDSLTRSYCPPGNIEGNCASGQDPSPIAHFDFNGKNTATAFDVSGSGNNGTINGSVVTGNYEPGVIGSGLTLNGTSQYIAADTIMDTIAANNATVSGWFKTKDPGTSTPEIFSINSSACLNRILVYIDSSGNVNTNSTNGTYAGTAVVNDGAWHHIELVFSDTGNMAYIWIDGKLDFSHAATFALDAGDYFSLGQEYDDTPSCPTASNFFPGSLDEFIVYPYARTDAQIHWDYGKDTPDHWYKLDECQNSSIYDSGLRKQNGTITPGDSSGDNDTVGTCTSGGSTEMWGEGATGKIEGSLAFDGTNDLATLGDVTILEGANKASWAFWVKPSNLTTSDCIVCKIDVSPAIVNAWAITTGGTVANNVGVSIPTTADDGFTSGQTATAPLQNGTWTHVVVTYDGTQATNALRLKIYVNGIQETLSFLGTIPGTLLASAIPMTIGGANDNGAVNFAGSVDDLRIYNYILSEYQIHNLYNLGAAFRIE